MNELNIILTPSSRAILDGIKRRTGLSDGVLIKAAIDILPHIEEHYLAGELEEEAEEVAA